MSILNEVQSKVQDHLVNIDSIAMLESNQRALDEHMQRAREKLQAQKIVAKAMPKYDDVRHQYIQLSEDYVRAKANMENTLHKMVETPALKPSAQTLFSQLESLHSIKERVNELIETMFTVTKELYTLEKFFVET